MKEKEVIWKVLIQKYFFALVLYCQRFFFMYVCMLCIVAYVYYLLQIMFIFAKTFILQNQWWQPLGGRHYVMDI